MRAFEWMTATELLDGYANKTFSPIDVAQALLKRIEKLDHRINSFCLIDHDRTLAAARESEQRWMNDEARALEGVPVAIKDLLLTKGWPTLRGSLTVDPDGPWHEDAPSVARLVEAGCVPIGKTTTPEFGWKGVTDNPLTGITRNPWDPSTTPGGSSGGSSAAVAAGFAPFSLGTDGGGSIRIPASFAGIFGHKPSFGRVPAFPASPFGTVAHVGPMTRTVEDAALMMNEIIKPSVRDWYALPYEGQDYLKHLWQGVRGWRIAYSPDFGFAEVDPEVAKSFEQAVETLRSLGATMIEATPPMANPRDVFHVHWWSGAAKLLSTMPDDQLDRIDLSLRRVKDRGDQITRLEYQNAVAAREAYGAGMLQFMADFDLLISPATPITAFEAGRLAPLGDEEDNWTQWTPFTWPINLTQQPACSVPCGFDSKGLPIGLQMIGHKYDDRAVFRAAHAFEEATEIHKQHPEGFA